MVEANEYATVGDLLREINAEDISSEGSTVTFKSLERTLRLIKEISGVSIEGAGDKVNVNTLRVIKLLFQKSDKRVGEGGERINSRNIFGLLQRPEKLEPSPSEAKNLRNKPAQATMESCTGTTIPMDREGAQIIGELVSALAMGIDPEKLATLEAILGSPELCGSEQAEALSGSNAAVGGALRDETEPQPQPETRSDAEKLMDRIALGTEAVEDLVYRQFANDDTLMASAYLEIASEISKPRLTRRERTEVPVHEALYVHARTLGLQHFILHHRSYLNHIRVGGQIGSIDREVWSLCEQLGDDEGLQIQPSDFVLLASGYEEFARKYSSQLIAAVEVATKLETEKRVFKENIRRAKHILSWDVYRRYDRTRPADATISVVDIVAAHCSVRYQQGKLKTEYMPYWEGQGSQGKSPQRMLDASIERPTLGTHQGVFLLYYNRYKDYRAAFTGASESHRAFAHFESCRFDAYLEAMQSRSLMEFQAATLGIDNLGLIIALDIVYANVASAPIAAYKPCD